MPVPLWLLTPIARQHGSTCGTWITLDAFASYAQITLASRSLTTPIAGHNSWPSSAWFPQFLGKADQTHHAACQRQKPKSGASLSAPCQMGISADPPCPYSAHYVRTSQRLTNWPH